MCAPRGRFCFSSHNLQYLPAFLEKAGFPDARLLWQPVRWLQHVLRRRRLVRRNREQLARMPFCGHITIYDDAYDFGLETLYVRPSDPIAALHDAGFARVRLFGSTTGAEITQPVAIAAALDPWIYYLCE